MPNKGVPASECLQKNCLVPSNVLVKDFARWYCKSRFEALSHGTSYDQYLQAERTRHNMSTTVSGIRQFVGITQASETLASLLQNAATETRPAVTTLKTREPMTCLQPSGSSIGAVLKRVGRHIVQG